MGALGGSLMGGLAAIFGRKIMRGLKGVVATGRKAVGSLTDIVGKVIKKVMPRAAARMAAGAGAGAFMGPGGVVAVEAGLLAYTLYDVVDELKKELTGSGLFDGFDIASVFPSMDSINEGFDSVLEKFAKFGDGVATSITGESGPFQPSLSQGHVAATPATNTSNLGSAPSDFEDLKNLIQSAESKEHGYDAVVSNNETPKPPTEMTVGEVLQWQKAMKADPNNAGRSDLTAIGRYQFIHTTLVDTLKSTDVKMSDKFDAETQDKLFMARLRYRGLNDYISGKIDKKQFIDRLSLEWAGLKNSSGVGSHDGVGINKGSVEYESTYNVIPDPEQLRAAINSREEAKVTASEQAAVAVTPENQTPVILSAEEVNKLSTDIQKSGNNPAKAKQMQAQNEQPVYRGMGPAVNNQSNPQPARSQESSFSLLQTVEKMLGY
jgi:muramidase (phage lysozyme)